MQDQVDVIRSTNADAASLGNGVAVSADLVLAPQPLNGITEAGEVWDVIFGMRVDDKIDTGLGIDFVFAGKGDDTVHGSGVGNLIVVGDGRDTCLLVRALN